MYINNQIPYQRRTDLEKLDCGIIIIDLNLSKRFRIIGLYRTFTPNNNVTKFEYFKKQMDIISLSWADQSVTSVVLGDFNMDENQRNNAHYSLHRYYDLLQSRFNDLNLIQLIKFNTWSRLVDNIWKESCLDHLYTNDTTTISNITSIIPIMGDHKIISATLGAPKPLPKITERRSWKNYSKTQLLVLLNEIVFDLEITSVQELANNIENNIIRVVDTIAPIKQFINNRTVEHSTHPHWLKKKLNLRKNLLKKLKHERTPVLKTRIKNLSIEIKNHFTNETRAKVRQGIKPGNNKTLWDAVKIAKDQNIEDLPDKMNLNGKSIANNNLAEAFADMFEKKVNEIVSTTSIDANVYNGFKKINVENKNFMTTTNIINAIQGLKLKNSEGFDRIPQRILIDGMSALINF